MNVVRGPLTSRALAPFRKCRKQEDFCSDTGKLMFLSINTALVD